MLVNVNGMYYVHVCEQARLARSAGNSAIENVCIIITERNQDVSVAVEPERYGYNARKGCKHSRSTRAEP